MKQDEPITVDAQEYADKLFQCEEPCDSYGICAGCVERRLFLAGYNFGYRGGRKAGLEEAITICEHYTDHEGKNQAHWAAKVIRELLPLGQVSEQRSNTGPCEAIRKEVINGINRSGNENK